MEPTLIIFAALALFLAYRLFNVLGTRGGHEPEEHERPVLRPVPSRDPSEEQEDDFGLEAEPTTPSEDLPEWAVTARKSIPDFEPKRFLEGAAAAYEMIVQAYADGDLSTVRGFVDPEVLKSFEVAIEGRTAHGQSVDLTFVGVETPEVLSMEEHGGELRAELRFKSEQVRAVRDAKGEVIDGNPEEVITVIDEWTFSRPVRSNDPNWTLVATHGTDTE
ncbi:Tim44/TimA family putative adaptor protein [Parvularcula lutaonensis]|uniref:Tim44/TimA family putative adaptor protein n=1 Tax=Parvularcula lutaonensis TaxID=491923 RepID=A0ABV7MBI4_9PROT|nr:Tim44/TimA family putative adaptor protein [Parvularcula lutaonensis]GGY36034.1 calcium-binding protein [Parvularcula lutaonensis]